MKNIGYTMNKVARIITLFTPTASVASIFCLQVTTSFRSLRTVNPAGIDRNSNCCIMRLLNIRRQKILWPINCTFHNSMLLFLHTYYETTKFRLKGR